MLNCSLFIKFAFILRPTGSNWWFSKGVYPLFNNDRPIVGFHWPKAEPNFKLLFYEIFSFKFEFERIILFSYIWNSSIKEHKKLCVLYVNWIQFQKIKTFSCTCIWITINLFKNSIYRTLFDQFNFGQKFPYQTKRTLLIVFHFFSHSLVEQKDEWLSLIRKFLTEIDWVEECV